MRIRKKEFQDSLATQNYGVGIYFNSQRDSLIKLIYLPEKIKQQMIKDLVFDTSPYLKNQLNKVFFDFTYQGLDGKVISKDMLKGKVIVLNYWFIGCVGCIMEITALNKLVDNYQKNKDIIFLAPTNDSKDKLDKFLRKNQFKYKVVSTNYKSDLFINSFPTHILVDKLGITRFIYSSGPVNINYILDKEIEKCL